MKNTVTEFIKRRFPDDCSWTTGNCYFFAVILKARFPKGEIYYDVIDGHFVFKLNDTFYDHTGLIFVNTSDIVLWDKFKEYDEGRYKAIVRGCIK